MHFNTEYLQQSGQGELQKQPKHTLDTKPLFTVLHLAYKSVLEETLTVSAQKKKGLWGKLWTKILCFFKFINPTINHQN